VLRYRARELQLEALNSEKLKAYFEDTLPESEPSEVQIRLCRLRTLRS